jgi:hypothetical protein
MKIIAFLLIFILTTQTHAYESEAASNSFAHEAAECSAYFLFASAAPGLGEKTVKGLQSRYEQLLQISVALSSEKLTKARFELAIKTMKREMDENWKNMSIINNKYGYPCIDLSKDPEARFKYWLSKED